MAQTGRIKGVALDMQSGEPLIGANIVVVGTNFGATTDVNGNFLITQVPVGIFNLKASYVGYRNVTIEGIRVVSGLTAEANFKLPSSDIVTAEMVIVSQRPLVEKSATNAIRIVSTEDIDALPTRSIAGIVGLQAGVVLQDGNTYVRGSRADETGYLLAGVDVKSITSANGGSVITVTPDALQEITVQAGGYTAEFGNANAGIVSEDFKTGGSNYHYSARAETDNFGNYPGKQFLKTYSYGYSDYTVTASGPITDNLKFFISGENNFTRDQTPRFFDANPTTFSDGAAFATTGLQTDGYRTTGIGSDATHILTWGAGNVLGQFNNRYTTNGTLIYDLKPLILRLAGAFSWSHGTPDLTSIRQMFDRARLPNTDRSNALLDLKGTYFLDTKSFIEASVNYLDTRYKNYDPNYKDNLLAYDDSLNNAVNGWTYSSRTSGPSALQFYNFPFSNSGADLTGYEKSETSKIGFSASYTAQIEKHELKLGGDYTRWTMRDYQESGFGGILQQILADPNSSRNPNLLSNLITNNSGASLSNYGYDVFGNEVSSGEFGPKHPVFADLFAQDRFELGDLIINAGLRFDYFSLDSWKLRDYTGPIVDKTTWTVPDSVLTKAGAYMYISPRLGFSFPVTDRTVFHLQYGKFVQAPSLGTSYQGITYTAHVLNGGTAYSTPTAFDLQPERTTQYEIGFTEQFSDFAAFDVTAFYKDISGQVLYTAQLVNPSISNTSGTYYRYINSDFSTTKGIELKLTVRRTNRVRAELNYTYSDARGTGSTENGSYGTAQTTGVNPSVILPLDQNQTHRGSLVFDYRFAKNDGGPILEQLGINILFTFDSGHPYTAIKSIDQLGGLGQLQPWEAGVAPALDARQSQPVEPINSSVTPWNYSIDFRIDKTVSIFDFDVNFYVYVQNLLNTKNVINVYPSTGNAYDDGFLESATAQKLSATLYGTRFVDLYKAINLTNRQAQLFATGNDLFGTPRQIRAGILINF